MQYHEAVNYLNSLPHSRPVLDTETTASMLDALEWDGTDVAFVQVAGSNGKGSTARMLESMLREADLDVGLYTSPDLNDLRERVRVNGRKVSKAAVERFVDRLRPRVDELESVDDEPTFFEVLTVLALWHFANRDVDVAVLEVGIGGRYDATSVVDPVASAVTTVSLEHTELLGDTIAEIARDKASVAPDDAPLVTAATGDALATLREEASLVTVGGPDSEHDPDVVARERGMASATEAAVTLDGPDWHVETRSPLLGDHQALNAGVAAVLARQVAGVSTDAIARGLRSAHWPGRFEIVGREPLTVLDGAHNPGAVRTLSSLLDRFAYDDLHVVVGAMDDKDHEGMAAAFPDAETLLACRPDVDRAADADEMAETFRSAVAGSVETAGSVLAATDRALDRASGDDCVLVTGSLSTVAEARDRWTRPYVRKQVDDLDDAERALASSNVPATAAAATSQYAVHHTIKTYVRRRQRETLQEAATEAGVTCAGTGVEDPGEHQDVVLSGTRAAFHSLAGRLDDADDGLGHLADGLRRALGFETPDRSYPWGDGPAIMGVLNVTPDSFHDGGEYDAVDAAVSRAREMMDNGVDVVDVGGESTRPGAEPVPVEEEKARVVPVVERLADLDVPISVDTRKAPVARAALEVGADIVNDVSGLEDPDVAAVAAEYDAPIVVMHSINAPVDPGVSVEYDDVVEDVIDELTERVLLAERAGLDREQIILDPGLGFGKSPAEDFELVERLDELHALGCPVLVGHSHKSMFGHVDCEHGDRLAPTVAVTAMAAERGADLIRVHDVKENAAAVRAVEAARGADRTE